MWLQTLVLVCSLSALPWEQLNSNNFSTRQKSYETLMKQASSPEACFFIAKESLERLPNSSYQSQHYLRLIHRRAWLSVLRYKQEDRVPVVNKEFLLKVVKGRNHYSKTQLWFYVINPKNEKLVKKLIEETETINFYDELYPMIGDVANIQLWIPCEKNKNKIKIEKCVFIKLNEPFVFGQMTSPGLYRDKGDCFEVEQAFTLNKGVYPYGIAIPHEYTGGYYLVNKITTVADKIRAIMEIQEKDNCEKKRKEVTKRTWEYWKKHNNFPIGIRNWSAVFAMDHQINSQYLSEMLNKKVERYAKEEVNMYYYPYEQFFSNSHILACNYLMRHGTKEALPGLFVYAQRYEGEINWPYITMLKILQRHYDQKWIDKLKKIDTQIHEHYPYIRLSTNAKVLEMLHKDIRVFPKYKSIYVRFINFYECELFYLAEEETFD